MTSHPRVALFADSFHEVNGVALTCRALEDYARRNHLPMLSVHAGPRAGQSTAGSITQVELPTSKLALGLEQDLRFDLLFARHLPALTAAMRGFQPSVVHITGPSHLGILGALLAHRLRLPLVASWHTNVHQYAARRLPACAPAGLRRPALPQRRLRLIGAGLAIFRRAPHLGAMLLDQGKQRGPIQLAGARRATARYIGKLHMANRRGRLTQQG